MEIINNSNSVIIVLHEIYGVNQHIKMVCEKFFMAEYDIVCPNLIDLNQPLNHFGFKARKITEEIKGTISNCSIAYIEPQGDT